MASRRGSLADHLESLDSARFVGRGPVIAQLDRMLAAEVPARVALIHGPGGIGKSALLRAIGRRAAQRHGRPTWSIDGRELQPVPGDLEDTLAPAIGTPDAVVLIDAFEHVPALDSLLRDHIVPGLDADAVVVVAGRHAPSPAWFSNGWEHVTTEIPLGPLPRREAFALLAALDVTDTAVAARLVDWAGGSPLALSLAASEGSPDLASADLQHMILRRLAGEELGEIDGEVIQVAAVAPAVDARMLAAVLPGRPTRAANGALRACSVAEPVGARVTLHDLVRSTLRDDLRHREPTRYNQLRCRIADHLHARAAAGETGRLSDLVDLLDDPAMRWGLGADVSGRYRVDPWRPQEVAGLVEQYIARMGDSGWWDDLAPLLEEAPELGLVALDLDGAPLAFCIATATSRAPVAAQRDPVLGPVLSHARNRPGPPAMIYRESFGVSGPAGQAAASVLHMSAVLRSGEANVERSYILDTAVDAASLAFFQAVEATHHQQLDVEGTGRRIECWVVDHGPGGMLGQLRDAIYAEVGTPAPSPPNDGKADRQRAAIDALRAFNRPDVLARSPLLDHLPTSADTPERTPIERLRTALLDAVAASFGESHDERLLRQAVELGDLDPTVAHDQAMERLAVSRATYYRHLRRARNRVAATLAAHL